MEQAQQRLRIADLAAIGHGERFFERLPMDLDAFVRFVPDLHGAQIPGEKQMDDLVAETGGGEHPRQRPPVAGLDPGFLGEFALRRLQSRFVRLELARRQFPQPAARRMAVLPQQADRSVRIERADRRAARVPHDLQFDVAAVRQGGGFDAEIDDGATVDGSAGVQGGSPGKDC